MALLFAPADFRAAENEQRHQRMQVEQHRREMNVATNLAGLINKNNPPQWQTFLHMVHLYVNRLVHSSLPSAARPRRLYPFLPGQLTPVIQHVHGINAGQTTP